VNVSNLKGGWSGVGYCNLQKEFGSDQGPAGCQTMMVLLGTDRNHSLIVGMLQGLPGVVEQLLLLVA
jgi:hypothetical protein